MLAEVFRAGVLAVPKGQAEAAYAIGMRKTQVMTTVLLPQAVKIMMPAIISQCVVALKDTSLGYAVAGPDLGGQPIYGVRQPGADDHRARRSTSANLVLRIADVGAAEVRRREEALEVPMVGDRDRRRRTSDIRRGAQTCALTYLARGRRSRRSRRWRRGARGMALAERPLGSSGRPRRPRPAGSPRRVHSSRLDPAVPADSGRGRSG